MEVKNVVEKDMTPKLSTDYVKETKWNKILGKLKSKTYILY